MAAIGIDSAEALCAELERLLQGHTDRNEEADVLSLLREAPDAALDLALCKIDVNALISGVDNRLFGPDNRTALLRLLTEERVGALNVPARANLVAALQRGRTSSLDEKAIAEIFLKTHGRALSALKNAVDAGDDHRNLFGLLYHDIDNSLLRDAILNHIQVAAEETKEIKILSDIDDTLYPNWKDERYPKTNRTTGMRYTYPGITTFYRELDLARASEPSLCDLTFLTARPGDRLGASQTITREHLTALSVGYAKILTGDFSHLLTHELMAEKKYQSFIAYRRLFPEYDFVFCGDSGQGDAIAGALMIDHPGGAMKGVFIHDVVDTSEEEREAYRKRGVYFHDTYVGAALNAFALGLLDSDAVLRVADAALAELSAIEFDSDAQRDARFAEILRDQERAKTTFSS